MKLDAVVARACERVPSLMRGTPPSFTLASTAAVDTIAVWWRDTLLYAVACGDRRGIAVIVAHHLDEDRA